MNSIIQQGKYCYICGCNWKLELHHVFGGVAHRPISDREGLTVWLCANCHRTSNESVHLCREQDLIVKRKAQKKWLELHNNDMDQWFKLFHKSWLE